MVCMCMCTVSPLRSCVHFTTPPTANALRATNPGKREGLDGVRCRSQRGEKRGRRRRGSSG
eukprot:scaffold34492_cov60-Phaeocystis_antarctica.AAC.6